MSIWETAKTKWAAARPAVIFIGIGLVVGPFISNIIGWQVTSGHLEKEVRAATVEQQALFCEGRARADVGDTSDLDWSARRELADKWAVMPGQDTADATVSVACARKLAG